MSDPIGLIGSVGGAGGVQGPQQPGVPQGPGQTDGPNFRDVLLKNMEQVTKLEHDASEAIHDLQSGRRSDLEGVLLATQKAETAFDMLQAVRNKMMTALEELKQMRV